MEKFARIILFICLFIVLTPLFARADLELEQTYPILSQNNQNITITKNASLIETIKFYSTWAIVISVLAAIVSLTISGVQYLTAGSSSRIMAAARSRIIKAFLGIIILTSSYVILRIINPQAQVLQIRKVPIKTAILALSEKAVERLRNEPNVQISDLIESKEAYYLPFTSFDLTKILGRLVAKSGDVDANGNVLKVNFEKTKFEALGFWGDESKNIEVILYSGKGLLGTSIATYTYQGKVNWKWEVERQANEYGGVYVVDITPDFTDDSIIKFVNTANNPETEGEQAVKHPFLSLKSTGIGPGVYLYSSDDMESQLYVNEDKADLSMLGFDDKAEKIKIINIDPRPGASNEKHNYLAVLFDESYFYGSFRIFFQKFSDQFIPKLFFEENDFYKDMNGDEDPDRGLLPSVDLDDLKDNSNIWNPAMNANTNNKYFRGIYILRDMDSTGHNLDRTGNVDKPILDNPAANKADVNGMDEFGKVNGVSSIRIFELSEKKSVCKEVRLCNQTYGAGKCISYTNFGTLRRGLYDAFNLPMPFYIPVNLPAIIKGTVRVRQQPCPNDPNTLCNTKKLDVNEFFPEQLMFKRNIRSIIIDGKCLVALYKNPVNNLKKCVEATEGIGGDIKDCWKKGGPGAGSEIFTETDNDLTDNLIGSCPAREVGRFSVGKIAPCAAAIAVYPIK